MRLGILASHPIQYHAPLFRELAGRLDLEVFFAHRQTPEQQAAEGYGVAFDWDRDLLEGYAHRFLVNRARRPGVAHFGGRDTPEIGRHIRKGGYDAFLVTGWHLKSYWQAVIACRQAGVPVMVRGDSQLLTPRNPIKRWVKALAFPWLLRCFDAALFVGQRNREYLEHYGFPRDKLFFAPHCVDVEFFARGSESVNRNTIRAAWGVEERDAVVLFVGRLVPLKRLADLVTALSLLRASGRMVTAVFAGSGEMQPQLVNLGRNLAVPLVFLGFRNQQELPKIYSAADILVLPSSSESWGLVVNEALACGTPAVVSDACGCGPDLIAPGETGENFPMGSVPELAAAIERCLNVPHRAPALEVRSAAYGVQAAADGVVAAACWLVAQRGGLEA